MALDQCFAREPHACMHSAHWLNRPVRSAGAKLPSDPTTQTPKAIRLECRPPPAPGQPATWSPPPPPPPLANWLTHLRNAGNKRWLTQRQGGNFYLLGRCCGAKRKHSPVWHWQAGILPALTGTRPRVNGECRHTRRQLRDFSTSRCYRRF